MKCQVKFLSTLSLRRATPRGRYCYLDNIISIHALLAESDHAPSQRPCHYNNFYPRSPCGERLSTDNHIRIRENFYPRSPCGERPVKLFRQNYECFISIHALLAESDGHRSVYCQARQGFLSTLSLRRATHEKIQNAGAYLFLSTLSLRRATRRKQPRSSHDIHFYPRSPCGERRRMLLTRFSPGIFLSTLSLRRATCYSLRHSA